MRRHMCQKIILAIAFFVIIGAELLYSAPLNKLTFEIVPNMQKPENTKMIKLVEVLSYIFGGKVGACVVLCFVAIQHDKPRFFYYVFNITTAFVLANALRMGYTVPRPFWVGEQNG